MERCEQRSRGPGAKRGDASVRESPLVVDTTGVPLLQRLGPTSYEAGWRAMQAFTSGRSAATADEIWLTEHEPIYTLGLAGRREHVLRDNGIPVLKVDRGGQVTYHGPGQVVVYVLVDLARRRLGVRELVRMLESCVIEFLESCDLAAYAKAGAPGVYLACPAGEAKIAALGLRVRNGCTYHGLALNVDMDLTPFADIDPCGYRGLAVTQLKDLGVERRVDEVGLALATMLSTRLRARLP